MPIEQLMWIEKYRPASLDALVDQEGVKQRLKLLIGKKAELPHLLFAGPPGSGKTTTALIIAKQILGDIWRDYTLSLNASVAPDTPVMVRIAGETRLVDFQELAEKYYTDGSSKYAHPTDLEVLSLDRVSLKAEFKRVTNISRHKAPLLAEIEFNGGSVSATLEHSVMVLNDDGEIEERAVYDLGKGDHLVTFNSEIQSNSTEISAPEFQAGMRRGVPVDPATGLALERVTLDPEGSWVFGSYMAEGCVALPEGKGGTIVLAYRYPHESGYAKRAAAYFSGTMGLHTHAHTVVSGSSGRRSSIQLSVCSKTLARFMANHFYSKSAPRHVARSKRVPDFIFDAPADLRREFLKGYMGDASGDWQKIIRYSSKSERCLVGTSWLGRVTGLHTSIFENECRIVWNRPGFSYFVGELIAARPFVRFFEHLGKKAGFNWRYELRHQLYSKRSKAVSRTFIANLLKRLNVSRLSPSERASLAKLKRLASSCLYTTQITDIRVKPHDGYVYDVCVPGSQTFWGGTTPILLHNSDERGIDMVRERVKTFARFSDRREGVPFRLVVLDEADEMCLDPDTRILVGRLDDLKEMSLRELQESFGNKQFDLPSFGPRAMRLENDKGRIVPSGRAELYTITFEDGRVISASADHPFFVIRSREVVTMKTRDLVPGEELADFSDKILRCYNCGRPFYRPNQFAGYTHHFCSTGCRDSYFGSLSTARTRVERREIGLKGAEALKAMGVYQSSEYRRKRAEIATRLIREGRIPDPRTWRKFIKGEGAWVGKRLSSEHKKAIGEGSSRFFAGHPEVREAIGRKVRVSLLDPSGPYQHLVRAGFFKKTSMRANEASLNSWKKKGFRSETEVKMARLLEKWNIPYERERVILTTSHGHKYPFAVDFVIRGKVALLVNGCWWHVCPTCGVTPQYEKQRRNMEKDYRHAAELERLGYKVVVVWEHELKSEKSIQEYVLPKVFETVGVAGGPPPKVKHSKVKSVKLAGLTEVLNISVTQNTNFLLANGILTHNTNDAQTALRRIMEETSTFTRFILICNYSSGIIEPLQSRCAIFRFQRLDEGAVVTHLKEIAKKEKVKASSDSVFGEVFEATQGDLRQAINLLQAASVSGELTVASVKSVSGATVKTRVAEIVKLALDGDFEGARAKMIELTRVYGVPERDFLKYANEALNSAKLDDIGKAISIMAEYDFRLVQGAQPELQLTAMLAELSALKRK